MRSIGLGAFWGSFKNACGTFRLYRLSAIYRKSPFASGEASPELLVWLLLDDFESRAAALDRESC